MLGQVHHESPILRSVAIGDVLFSIARNDVKASRLRGPSETIGAVALHAPGDPDWYTAPPMNFVGIPSIVIPPPIEDTIPEVVHQPPPDPGPVPGPGPTTTDLATGDDRSTDFPARPAGAASLQPVATPDHALRPLLSSIPGGRTP
ncbi:MAG: hypothetical protein WKF75_17845 [Singulisphaera sp.]